MAFIAFPSLAKKAILSDNTTYSYVASAPTVAGKPTFLLLHGCPSSCWDWRHQIESLSAAGFGVITPDLLGYGETDSPADVTTYNWKSMSQHMAEILDHEGVKKCIAVAHDWGSGLLSRLTTYIPDHLIGAIFISVGYMEPGFVWDIDAVNKLTMESFGYPTYRYWYWHIVEEAMKDYDEQPASAFSLVYPGNSEDWKVIVCPVRAASEYVRSGRLDPLPAWYNLAEYTTWDRIMSKRGYQGPLNWYKSALRDDNLTDKADISEEDKYCKLPTLFVTSDQDYVTSRYAN